MKKLLLVLLTLLLVVSCTKDDNTSNSNTQTFLEKYDGFGFVKNTEFEIDHLYVYNNPVFLIQVIKRDESTVPFSSTENLSKSCISLEDGMTDSKKTIKIITNENDNLLFEAQYKEGDVVSVEINVVGNTLTVSNSNDDEITTYTKTAVEYSSHNCN